MAKVIGLLKLRGTIDDVTFRKTKEGNIAGRKPGPSREKVLTHENFRRTRRNAGEFKLVIEEATLFRYALGGALNGRTGSSLNGRMYGLFSKAARQDSISDLGSRRASAGAIDLLRGFDFNKELSLKQALPVRLTHRLDVTTGASAVQVPAFIARKRKKFPAEATHFRILSGVVMVDFVHGHYRRVMQCSELLPLRKKVPHAICFEHQLEPGEGQVMVQVLGMEFYKLEDGKEVLIKGSAVRVLEAVRVEEKGNETPRHKGNKGEVETRIESEVHELECKLVPEDTNQGEVETQAEDELPGMKIEEELQELGVRLEKGEGMKDRKEKEDDTIGNEIGSCNGALSRIPEEALLE
jgi:hypothetical protein